MKTALCFGTFDGLHKGHKKVLSLPIGFKKIVVTFSVPPKLIFSGEKELLMTYKDKLEALKDLGVDEVLTLDFELVKDMSPEDFLASLYEKYSPSLICCGFNYRFGNKAKGDTETLKAYCEENGIALKVTESVNIDGKTVSSTLIRDCISKGEIEKANELLYKPFGFTAEVVIGDQRGRNLGFPTANQTYPEKMQKLKFGVYRSRVFIDGIEYKGISNIGIRPTYQTEIPVSETYIYDFSGDIYGKNIRIEPVKFLRSEQKFSSAEELKKAVLKDILS